MSDDLTVRSDGIVEMFYAGKPPWHQLGTGVTEAKTSAEAIVLAHLDWTVAQSKIPYIPTDDGVQLSIDNRYAIYRDDMRELLGISTDRYQIVQNARMFSFMDSLLQDGVMRYETAGSLFEGKQIWILARLKDDMRVGDDVFLPYLFLTSRHDLNGSLTIKPTIIRVVCGNTLQMALVDDSGRTVRIVHTGNTDQKMEEARKVLSISTAETRRLQTWMEELKAVEVKDKDVEKMQTTMFGSLDNSTSAQRKSAISEWRAIHKAEKERFGPNGYSLLNAVTGYADHRLRTRERPDHSERLVSIMQGTAQAWKAKAFRAIEGATHIKAPVGIK